MRRVLQVITINLTRDFWDYSGIGILGIEGICVLLGASVFRMNGIFNPLRGGRLRRYSSSPIPFLDLKHV